jgi:hypothetical protein
MATQTIKEWPNPEIKHEGMDQNEPPRKRKKHVRKYSIISIAWFWIRGAILAAALCVVIGAAGNAIEMIARM